MKSLKTLPLMGTFIKRAESDVKKNGLKEAMRKALARSGTKLEVHGLDTKTEQILKSKPVVVLCNHPDFTEILAVIASLPERNDSYLVGNRRVSGYVPSFDKHLIPVYVDHNSKSRGSMKILRYLVRKQDSREELTPEAEHKKNRESVILGAKKVKSGGMVIIFPGGRKLSDPWLSGVGHMLKQIDKNKEVYVTLVYAQGTSAVDIFRLVPGAGRLLPKLKLTFAKPFLIKDTWDKDPKKMTKKLENHFNKWVRSGCMI